MKQFRSVQFAAFVLIIATFVAVRFWGITDSCLWFDEIFSVHAAEHPWHEIFSFVALDLIHPPLFYVRLKLWIAIVGDDVFWLRLLPVIISCIAIIPFLLLCRELKIKMWVTAFALFLLAVNGSMIKYAQEVRMYSLLMCLALFSMWLFARYFNRRKSFVALLIVNVLLVYTHYFGWFVVSAEVVAIIIFQRARWRQIVVMFAIVFASFLPWVIAVWQAARGGSDLGQNIGWMMRPGPIAIIQFVLSLIEPFYYQASSGDSISVFKTSLPILMIAIVAVILYFANWNKHSEEERQTVKLLVLFMALPLIAAFAASWLLPYSIWGTRHLIIVVAPASILLAIAVNKMSMTALRTAALTLIVLFSAYAFVLQSFHTTPKYSWCAWEQLANHWITAPHYSAEPRTLYVFEELVGYHFWYSIRDFQNYKVEVVKGLEGINEDPAFFLPRGFDSVKIVDNRTAFSGDSFWIAFRDPDPDHDLPGIGFFSRSPQIFSTLAKWGFTTEDVRKIRVANESAFLAKMIRDPRPRPQE